jgi:hypothetical protein
MTPDNIARCGICGEPMPAGEEMFMYHGFTGPCPVPPVESHTPRMRAEPPTEPEATRKQVEGEIIAWLGSDGWAKNYDFSRGVAGNIITKLKSGDYRSTGKAGE